MPSDPSFTLQSHPPWLEAAQAQDAPERLGRYLLGPLLGQGGMGRVHEAWDPFLNRVVALKILHRDHPEDLIRFKQEAELQARVHHPNICSIFEVDLTGERPLIAMVRIQGPNLEQARKTLDRPTLLEILETVARAVHAAHEVGLIHRDLKPSNILLGPGAEGTWHPYVLDFGLAKDLTQPFTSRSQMGVGTPAFASPEQAAGLAVEAASDVYSLGATLHLVLSGFPPSEVPTGLQRAPLGLLPTRLNLRRRIPGFPKDLETLVATCLALNPRDRYPSALALAEDLRRFREGRPILARPLGWVERTGRWIRQHPRQVAIGMLALGLATGTGTWIRSRLQARDQQILLIQRFGRQAEQAEAALRAALLQPRHNLEPDLARIRTQVRAMAAETASLPTPHQGPGHLAMGRVFLALGEVEPALEHLQKAQVLGDHSPQLAQSLGCALGAKFEQELQAARWTAGAVGRKGLEEHLRQRYLGPIEALLGQALAGGDATFLKALLAHYRGQEEEALRLAQLAIAQDPGRLEAPRLLARVRLGLARQWQKAGETRLARRALEEAETGLAHAQSGARSDPALVGLTSDVWLLRGLMDLIGGENAPAAKALQSATTVAEEGLELHSTSPDLHLRLARAAFYRALASRHPEAHLVQAEAWVSKLIGAHAFEGEAHRWLGRILLMQAEHPGPGQHQGNLLERSQQALERATALGQPAEETQVRVRLRQAEVVLRRGGNPESLLQQALTLAEAALAKWGDEPAREVLREARGAWVNWQEFRGKDRRFEPRQSPDGRF